MQGSTDKQHNQGSPAIRQDADPGGPGSFVGTGKPAAPAKSKTRSKSEASEKSPGSQTLAAKWLKADGFPAIQVGGPLPSIHELAALMILGRIPFPFKRGSMPDPKGLCAAAQQAGISAVIEPIAMVPDRAPCAGAWGFDGEPLSLQISASAYVCIDQVTDYFTERARVTARICGKPSPLAAWSRPDYAVKIAETALAAAARGQRLNAHTLREAVYAAVPECTQFKVSLAWWVFNRFRAKVVLDPCAGWGDRIVGAAVAGVQRYLGADPNEDLREGHGELMRTLLSSEQQKAFAVEYTPFESLDLEKAGYCDDGRPDLVFTSPPFFDFEVYAEGPRGRGQSIEDAASFDDWLRGFLLPSLNKMWRALRPGGHLVLYLKDVKRLRLCEAVCRHIEGHLGGVHRATIACYRAGQKNIDAGKSHTGQDNKASQGRSASLRQCRDAGGKKGPNAVPLWVWRKRDRDAPLTQDPV